MDFLNKLLNRPSPKPAICHGSPTRNKSVGEPGSRVASNSHEQPATGGSAATAAAEPSLSSGPSSLAPESLSSASSFQSLSSKSSSGICADSSPGSPDKSYVNLDIPDLDELISACANININQPPEQLQQTLAIDEAEEHEESFESSSAADQTFASAADDTIVDETHLQQQLDQVLQTFETCPALDAIETPVAASTLSTLNPAAPVDSNQQVSPTSRSSLLPYVSFEESVLRKHQEKSEEFLSALTSFQQSVVAAEQIDPPDNTSNPSLDPAAKRQVNQQPTSQNNSPFATLKELSKQQGGYNLGSPDTSYKEISTSSDICSDTVVLISDTESDVSNSSFAGATNTLLQTAVSNSRRESHSAPVDVNEQNKNSVSLKTEVENSVHEKTVDTSEEVIATNNSVTTTQNQNSFEGTQEIVCQDSFNKTQDTVKQSETLNKTQDIANENHLNKTQDNIQQNDLLNKTQDIINENISNKTQDIVSKNISLNKTHEIVNENIPNAVHDNQNTVTLNETQNIQESILNKTQDIVNENILNTIENVQESVLNKTQDIVNENQLDATQIIHENNNSNEAQDIVQESVFNQTEDIVNENLLNTTQNIQESNILNNTKNIHENLLNKTQDIIQTNETVDQIKNILQNNVLDKTEENTLNKTQDIVQQENVINNNEVIEEFKNNNKNLSIVQEINVNNIQDNNQVNNSENICGKDINDIQTILQSTVQHINDINELNVGENLNDTQVIIQKAKQHLNAFDKPINKEESFKQIDDTCPNEPQNTKPEVVLDTNEEKEIKDQKNKILIREARSPIKNEVIVQNRVKTPAKTECVPQKEDIHSNLLNTELVASTPLPDKDLKEITPKTAQKRSALFPQDTKLDSNSEVSQALNNKEDLEQTVVLGKDNLEDIKEEIHDISLNLLQPTESEYEAFKPQQQSTNLPFPENFDFQEAALSVAKDIETSLEKIEENERFVSAHELFGDPSAFDFLNQLGSKTSKRGERYDSLFMKFDPLAQRLSMLPQKNLPTAPSVEEEVKETKAVEPPIPNMNTPKKNPAVAAIDRLLFYSPPVTSATESEVAEAKQKKEEAEKKQHPAPIVDEKMAKELELVRSTVLQLEAELEKQKRLHKEELEKLKAIHEEKLNNMQTKFSQMQSQLLQEVKSKDQMTVVVEEYEKSISRLIAEREKDRTNFEAEKAKLTEELQVANQHLSNTEAAFSDVHTKYERLKNVVSAYKTNESVLKESIAENQETIKTLENRYEQLKSHAMAQLEKANMELINIRKQNDAETIKLKALVRKAELKSKSLEETVEQKMKENKELTKIIDEMIARVD